MFYLLKEKTHAFFTEARAWKDGKVTAEGNVVKVKENDKGREAMRWQRQHKKRNSWLFISNPLYQQNNKKGEIFLRIIDQLVKGKPSKKETKEPT